MPQMNHMQEQAQAIYGEDAEIVVPRLMRELRTPYLVAVRLGVYANAVRVHLIKRGWAFKNGKWTEPEATHEPQP